MKVQNTAIVCILLAVSINALADEKSISINSAAEYYDDRIIPSNIREECKELGSQFSISTRKYLEDDGWAVSFSPKGGDSFEGTRLNLLITNALSSGNAFMGHRKSVSIEAELYKDGELVDTYLGTRDSGGGMAGGFKGSCSVLARCVNTLGKDVSKWLKKQDVE